MTVATQIRVQAAVLGIAIATLFEVGPLPGWVMVPVWVFVGALVLNAGISTLTDNSPTQEGTDG